MSGNELTTVDVNGSAAPPRASPPRRTLLVAWLYFRALVHEFRWTLATLIVAIVFASVLFSFTPLHELDDHRPNIGTAVYAAWMALLAQPVFGPPLPWYLALVSSIYPVFGVLLIGEGIVRLALLMTSRRQGEKEWMRVMASTYRDHVILCGLGSLGFRVLQQLVAANEQVVVLELSETGRFVAQGKALRVPVLIRDMKDDQALLDAGVTEARSIIIATNDDMANIEVALDSRRMNPKIRVVMRLFEQEIARKISGALSVDAVFSASALAAPTVAAMSLGAKVLGNTVIAGVTHLTIEIPVESGSALASKQMEKIESIYGIRVLAVLAADGSASTPIATRSAQSGERLVVHIPAAQLMTVAEAGRTGGS